MVRDLPQIDFRAALWDARAESDLAPAEGAAGDLDFWREGVTAGRLALWSIMADGERVGSLVWTSEIEHGGGRALVVQAMGARPCGVDLVVYADTAFAAMARAMGGASLRFWTSRRGMVRKTETLGYARRYVMEKEI